MTNVNCHQAMSGEALSFIYLFLTLHSVLSLVAQNALKKAHILSCI